MNIEHEKKTKKKFNNLPSTSYKYANKEYFQNIRDKNIIMPKKINVNYNKRLINSNSQNNITIRQNSKNKINIVSIVSKNNHVKGNYNIHNNNDEDIKDNIKNIHEQITSKGNNEEKSEDSKK